jgi:hypothetical protein
MLSNSICFGDNGGMLSEVGEAGVDFGGVVIVAEERLTDKFSQFIYSESICSSD